MKAFLKQLFHQTGVFPMLVWGGLLWLPLVTYVVIKDPYDPIAPWGYVLFAVILIIIVAYEAFKFPWKSGKQ